MVVTFSAKQASGHLRRLNPNKDLPQVVELLHLVFGKEMAAGGEFFRTAIDNNNPAFLWRFDPNLTRLSPGFVWETENKIVGNVTLLPARPPGRFLVANVAVHPEYRRRGFAKMLMIAAMEDVRDRQGREILLQVVKGNNNAVALYDSLGFHHLGDMTTWQTSVSRIRGLTPMDNQIKIHKLPKNKWREAYQIDNEALDPNLIWPEPYSKEIYKTSIWTRFFGYLNGQQIKSFVSKDSDGHLTGLAATKSEWGRPHEIIVRVRPRFRGKLERALLNRVIKTVNKLSRRNIRLIHNADDQMMNQLLPEANFYKERTLSHMRIIFM